LRVESSSEVTELKDLRRERQRARANGRSWHQTTRKIYFWSFSVNSSPQKLTHARNSVFWEEKDSFIVSDRLLGGAILLASMPAWDRWMEECTSQWTPLQLENYNVY
jgi:hypothetical protein